MGSLQSLFIKCADYFLADDLKSKLGTHLSVEQAETLRKSRILISMALISFPLIIGMFVPRYLRDGLGNGSILLLPFAAFLVIIVPFYIKRTGNTRYPAVILALMTAVIMPARTFNTGGITSAVALWICLIPLVTTMVLGARAGLLSGIYAVLSLLFIYKADRLGFVIHPHEVPPGIHFVVVSIVILAVTFFITNFESQRVKQNIELEKRAQDLLRKNLEIQDLMNQQRAMLNSLQEGFLLFNKDGRCENEGSKSAATHFCADPRGQGLWDLLSQSKKQESDTRRWLSFLFEKPDSFEVIKTLGPIQFKNAHNREIALDYFPFEDGNTEVMTKMVVVTRDVTDIQHAEEMAKRETAKSELIIKLMKNRAQFGLWIEQIASLLDEAQSYARNPAHRDQLMRQLHSLKGIFGLLGMQSQATKVHEMESVVVDEGYASGNQEILENLLSKLNSVDSEFHQLLEEFKEYLSGGDLNSNDLTLSEVDVKDLMAQLQTLGASAEVVTCIAKYFHHVAIETVLQPYQSMFSNLANKQGKKVQPFQWTGVRARVPIAKFRPFLLSLVHVVRNSVDHGIETCEERVRVGKPEAARLSWKTELGSGTLTLKVRDDGRGIDVDKIRKKVKDKGISVPEGLTEEDFLIAVLFSDGFSTRDQVSEISGRGVGLSAVKEELEKLGGHLRLRNFPGQGLEFSFYIPSAHLEDISDFELRPTA